jgi:hypothetical protein
VKFYFPNIPKTAQRFNAFGVKFEVEKVPSELDGLNHYPTLKTLGYCQSSLWDSSCWLAVLETKIAAILIMALLFEPLLRIPTGLNHSARGCHGYPG